MRLQDGQAQNTRVQRVSGSVVGSLDLDSVQQVAM